MIDRLLACCLTAWLLSCTTVQPVVETAVAPVTDTVTETILPTVLQPIAQDDELISADECWQRTREVYGTSEASVSLALKRKAEAFRSLAEETLALRESAIEGMAKLQEDGKTDGSKPLSGNDLNLLNEGMTEHLALRSRLFDAVNDHICWLRTSDKRYQELGMQPLSGESRLKGIMLSLSSALLLYDNYLLMASLYIENGKLRRFLNTEDPVYDRGRNELERLTVSYNSERKRKIARKAIAFYEEQWKKESASLAADEDFSYLNMLIEQSQSYNMLKKSGGLDFVGRRLTFMSTVTNDDLVMLKDDGVNLFSSLFGNTVGLVETRKGKLYGEMAVQRRLSGQLRAGDILLEKTPFRLTDKLIPGYWGHAAIWLGTEEELKELGVWDDPALVPYRDKIRKGESVVEALRSGVRMNSLQHFMNVDDLAALREPHADRETMRKKVLLALKQVGKGYDFNFDVETSDKIVCSELVYCVYTDIDWPTDRKMGRYTISPDNVAQKAIHDARLDLVALYHDGREVTSNQLETMAGLIGDEEASERLSAVKMRGRADES